MCLSGGPFHFVPMNAPVETSKPLKYTPPPKPVQNKSADSPLNRYKNAIKSKISENIETPKKKPKLMQPFMFADKRSEPEVLSDSEILPCPIPEEEYDLEVLPEPEPVEVEQQDTLPKPAPELLIEPEPEVLPEPEPEVLSEPEPEVVSEPEPDVLSEPEPEMPLKRTPDTYYGNHGKSYSVMEDEIEAPFDFLAAPIPTALKKSIPEVVKLNSEVTTSKPEVVTSSPKVVTSKSKVGTSNPEVVTSKPEVGTSIPKISTSKPEVNAGPVDSEPKPLASILTESIGRVSNANRMKPKV